MFSLKPLVASTTLMEPKLAGAFIMIFRVLYRLIGRSNSRQLKCSLFNRTCDCSHEWRRARASRFVERSARHRRQLKSGKRSRFAEVHVDG